MNLCSIMLYQGIDEHAHGEKSVQPTDEALAQGVQQGRTSDLATLVERHYDALMGYLYRMTGGNRMLSEDVAQETFARVLRDIASYCYPRPFKPWLYAIATNLARNHFKSADTRRTISTETGDLPAGDNRVISPEDALTAGDETRTLLNALTKLPAHQREVIVLRYSQELPLAEIAAALDIPVGTVKSRLSLGLRRLREVLVHDTN